MVSQLYDYLSGIGYHHPLHPVLTPVPAGLAIAGSIFMVLAYLMKRSSFSQTARHCTVLALLAAVPTTLAGYLDWQQLYTGAYLFPIKIKLGLAAALLILLSLTIGISWNKEKATASRVMVHLLSAIVVVVIGYFGGELIFEKKETISLAETREDAVNESIAAGEGLFDRNCSACHYKYSTDTKVGPGLKGVFERERMPVSGWPMSEESLSRQLKTPFAQMPPFGHLIDGEIETLTDFLKSI